MFQWEVTQKGEASGRTALGDHQPDVAHLGSGCCFLRENAFESLRVEDVAVDEVRPDGGNVVDDVVS